MDAPRPAPNILWRLFVLLGGGALIAVAVDDSAWEAFDDASGGTVSRDMVRAGAAGMAALHMAEALAAFRSARRADLDRPGRWAFSTLIWGFPVLLRLRTAASAD